MAGADEREVDNVAHERQGESVSPEHRRSRGECLPLTLSPAFTILGMRLHASMTGDVLFYGASARRQTK